MEVWEVMGVWEEVGGGVVGGGVCRRRRVEEMGVWEDGGDG